MMTLHLTAMAEDDPLVIVNTGETTTIGTPAILVKICNKPAFRVFPKTAKDIMYLRSLEHGVDKFAPCDGDGVIVLKEKITCLVK